MKRNRKNFEKVLDGGRWEKRGVEGMEEGAGWKTAGAADGTGEEKGIIGALEGVQLDFKTTKRDRPFLSDRGDRKILAESLSGFMLDQESVMGIGREPVQRIVVLYRCEVNQRVVENAMPWTEKMDPAVPVVFSN